MAYDRFAPLWRCRPQQPVRAAPALWWQHAGAAVLAECRRRLPVRRAEGALRRRREYLALYRALHVRNAREFVAESRAAWRAYAAVPGAARGRGGAVGRAGRAGWGREGRAVLGGSVALQLASAMAS